ncbi:GFA family protein [Amycolatopsis sp. NPDC051372]|uniref:GFA family protein n=1 Tax=Amycolatopsis sp. NPDC051372 TaxID=3155669 RepID=UPI00342F9CE9
MMSTSDDLRRSRLHAGLGVRASTIAPGRRASLSPAVVRTPSAVQPGQVRTFFRCNTRDTATRDCPHATPASAAQPEEGHTGSAFSENVLVARDAVQIEGTPKVHHTTGTENGHLRDRLFCGDCGTPIFTILHERPETLIVKGGTLDDRTGLAPSADVWWRRAQDWLAPHPTRARFDGDAR